MSKTPQEMRAYVMSILSRRDRGLKEVYMRAAREISGCWRVVMVGRKDCRVMKKIDEMLSKIRIIAICYTLDEIPLAVQHEFQKMSGSSSFPKVWANGKYLCSLSEKDMFKDPEKYGQRVLQKIEKNLAF